MSKSVADWIDAETIIDPQLGSMIQEESINADVAIQIYNARRAARLTQAELASLINTKQSNISRLEDADYDGHSLTMLKKVFAALGRSFRIHVDDPNPPDLDTPLSSGGRLKDYEPLIQFASQRVTSTFPADIRWHDLVQAGFRGVLQADQQYADSNIPFDRFSVPLIRGAMINEIKHLHSEGLLRRKTSGVAVSFGAEYRKTTTVVSKISRSVTRDVLQNFDQFHSVRLDSDNKSREVVLFSKVGSRKKNSVVYLTVAHQTDHDLYVSESYLLDKRLGEDVFHISPFQALKRIVDRFGLTLRVGNTSSKFILHETVPVRTLDSSRLVKLSAPPRHSHYLSTMLRASTRKGKKLADISMAYCIDTTKYKRWVNKTTKK
ncbi:MAG: XRE family transcriptional regulator [Pirellulales bacterium]|nr:XRE family transcriptional regulator [Pirellulales bacterium]